MIGNYYEVQGFYGRSTLTPTTIFIFEKRDGGKWYVSDGSTNVNLTYDEIPVGTNIEELTDSDFFEADNPVECIEDLEKEIEDYYG